MISSQLNDRPARLDALQLLAVIGLMLVGTVFVYSATMVNEPAGFWQQYHELTLPQFLGWLLHQMFFRQIIWYVLGGAAAVVLAVVHYQSLVRWAFVAYWATILALVAVLLPFIGSMRFGARRWIDLGFFQFQPSEFAKLAFILAMAHFASRPVGELKSPRVFWKAIGLMALPFLLIMKEPDLGSALVLLPTGLAMLLVAGTPRRYLLRLLAGAAILGALFLVDVLFMPTNWQVKLEDYQRRRLMVYFGKEDAPPAGATKAERLRLRQQQSDYSHNVRQALISVGSGGLTGKGWRQGTQNALGYLPRSVAHNDFIFSVIAEEKGFVGSVIVITLYGAVLFSGIRIAGQARDRLGKTLAVGIVTLIFSHVFINIGMNIRIMPVTGVPLPLLSYGGSSVLGSLIAMGILQNVYIYRKTY
ncbi:MAG: FtsW/RodA/SpoVE family cell cycle protein [Verrucomicrobia bacterium]|nr:FtsW/RodA/SpoVE family cell cycle protein [Verrucomicrobiota bacterium]